MIIAPPCHACQLGHHVRLPFQLSSSRASNNFDIIHCDLWTSPVLSVSGYKYYLVVLDDCSHYLWTFPLKLKSDAFSTLAHFFAYVHTQFGVTVKAVQCDNGREFDNCTSRTFFLTHGIHLRMSCPYTSPQNGKAERIIRSINNVVRSLLFQASLPLSFWLRRCRQPPTSSTSCQPRCCKNPHHTLPSSARRPPMISCVSLAANVIQTCQQPLPTNSLLGLHCVFS